MAFGAHDLVLNLLSRLDQKTFNQTAKEAVDRSKNMGIQAAEAWAKGHQDSAPKIRRASNSVVDATIGEVRADRAATKVRDERNKVTAKAIDLENELGTTQQRVKRTTISLKRTESDLNAARKRAAAQQRGLLKREENIRVKREAHAKQVEKLAQAELKLKDMRLEEKPDYAKIKVEDAKLQPLRKEIKKENKELTLATAAYARAQDELDSRNQAVADTKAKLLDLGKKERTDLAEIKRLTVELTAAKDAAKKADDDLIKLNEDVTKAMRKRQEVYQSFNDTLDEMAKKEADSAKRNNKRGNPNQRGASGVIGNMLTDLPFVPSGRAGAAIGTGVILTMASVAEAVVTASQAIAVLPAVATMAAAGIGTLALGFTGFGEAVTNLGDPKKFAEALQGLAPAAQQAALEIQFLAQGPLKDLKNAVQEKLFTGVAEQLHTLTDQLLPEASKLTDGIATSFNNMFANFSGELMAADSQQSIGRIIDNIVKAFQLLEPAVAPFTDALLRLTEVGAGFLPQLAQGITNAANSFAGFIQKAQSSGSLENFIQKGIDAAGTLITFLGKVGQDIYATFGNKTPEEFMATLEGVWNTIKQITEAISSLANGLNNILGFLDDIGVSAGDVLTVFIGWQAIKGVSSLLTTLGLVNTTLGSTIPGSAEKGAGRISRALSAVAIPKQLLAIAALFEGGKWAWDKGTEGFSEFGENTPTDPHGTLGENARNGTGIVMGVPGGRFPTGSKDKLNLPPSAAPGAQAERRGGVPIGPQPDMPAVPGFGMTFDPQRGWVVDESTLNGRVVPNGLGNPGDPAGIGAYNPFAVPDVPPTSDKDIRDALFNKAPNYNIDPMAPIDLGGLGAETSGAPGGTPGPGGKPPLEYGNGGKPYGKNSLGYYDVDQLQLLKQANGLKKTARELGDAMKDLWVRQNDGISSQRDIIQAQQKVDDLKVDLAMDQAQFAEDQQGKWKKLSKDQKSMKNKLGLDDDLGLSDGLAGLVENMFRGIFGAILSPITDGLAEIASTFGDGSTKGILGLNGIKNLSEGKSPILGNPLSDAATTLGAPADGLSHLTSPTGSLPGPAPAIGSYPTGTYPGDQALLASVPAGRYDNGAKDLGRGLADCSSSVEDLVNMMDGKSTVGGTLTTFNAAELLPGMGFQRGMGGPGDFRIGYENNGGGHMQATLPGGTPFNWGSNSAAANRGIGGTGADDPSFTDHWFRPAGGAGGGPAVPGMPGVAGPTAGSGTPVYVTNWPGGGGIAGGGVPGVPGAAPGTPGSGGTPAGAAPAGQGAERWRQTVSGVFDQYAGKVGIPAGQKDAWVEAIIKQIDTESGGDPMRVNPKDSDGLPANGLLQYKAGTYATTGAALTGLPMMDPIGQIAGALLAPRTASGAPDLSDPSRSIGAGHGWAPTRSASNMPGGAPAAPRTIAGAGPFSSGPLAALPPGGTPSWSGIPGMPGPATPGSPGPGGFSTPALTDPALANPGLTNPVPGSLANGPAGPLPAPGSVPQGGGPGDIGSALTGMPTGPGGPAAPAGPKQYEAKAWGAEGWQPEGGGFNGLGGLPMAAISSAIGAAGGAGSMFGGQAAGAAAQTGMELINRTIGYGGQQIGNIASGLLETFGMQGTTIGDPSKSWLGKIFMGFAGAKPAVPNNTGTEVPLKEDANQQGKDKIKEQQGPGGVNIQNFVQAENRNSKQTLEDLAYKVNSNGLQH